MTKAESLELLKYMIEKDDGMSATQIFLWGLVAAAFLTLMAWGVTAVIKTIKLETKAMVDSSTEGFEVLVKSNDMHIEELMGVKKDTHEILITLARHDGEIKNQDKRIIKLEEKG